MKPIVLSFCSLFFNHDSSQIKTFLHILDDGPIETFGSGQSSIMSEHKTKDCVGLRPLVCSSFCQPL